MSNEGYEEGEVILTAETVDECDRDEAILIRQDSMQRELPVSCLSNVFYSFWSVRRASHYKSTVQSYWWYHLRYSHLISKALTDKTYQPQPVDTFTVNERGKLRNIRANKVNDRVVNNLVDLIILRPKTEPKLIYDNGASRKGFGTDHSRSRLEKHCHDAMFNYGEDCVISLFDIKNFFGSIQICIALKQYRELIDSDDEYEILERQVLKHNEGPAGMGLGSVISQNAGLYYLHRFDNYIKIVLGCKYYGRYMDDFYIICRNKDEVKVLTEKIKTYLAREVSLELNERKTRVVKLTQGFKYLKFYYRVTPTGKIYKRQCNDTFIRERRKLKRFKNTKMTDADIVQSYNSWRGTVSKNKFNEPRLLKTDEVFRNLYPHLVQYVNF